MVFKHVISINSIEKNEFVVGFPNLAKTLPKPMPICVFSAHFTNGAKVTALEAPRTIHDFGEFFNSV
jgi:4,5-DOPA dioxygenase extradiol